VLYERVIRPLLFAVDPESAHHLSLGVLSTASRFPGALGWIRQMAGATHEPPGQPIRVAGLSFRHPVGLAAGFDKNAAALPAWEALGFSFVEAGTVTPRSQPGNPLPRLFRVPEDGALVNRLGFNNHGAVEVGVRLAALKQQGRWPTIPVGINVGKNKDTPIEEAAADYADCLEKLYLFADYFTINVSSPNTPELRKLQGRDSLDKLIRFFQQQNESLSGIHKIGRRPVFVKIAPDLDEAGLEDILAVCQQHRIDGIVATNTTTERTGLRDPRWMREEGGVSGRPLAERSNRIIAMIAKKTSGRLPIIGVGGVFAADDLKQKLDSGSTLVQVYTGFVYGGPGFVSRLLAR